MMRALFLLALCLMVPLYSSAVSAEEPIISVIKNAAYLSNPTQNIKRSAIQGEVLNPGDYLQVPRGNYAVIQSGKDYIRVSGGTMIGRLKNRLLKFNLESGGEVNGVIEGDTLGGIEIITNNASAKVKNSFFRLSEDNARTNVTVFRGGVSLNAYANDGVTGATFLHEAESSFVQKNERKPRESFLTTEHEFEEFNKVLREMNNPLQLNHQEAIQSLFRNISEAEKTRLLRMSPGIARELNSGSLRLIGSDVNVDDLELQVADENREPSRSGEVLF